MKKKILIITIIAVLLLGLTILGIYIYKKNNNNKANSEFIIQDTLEDGNNQKVKVILLAGQSNASGCSHISELEKQISNDKKLEYQNGYDNIYINYFNENGNHKSNGFTHLKWGQGANNMLFGPELGMGEKLNELFPGETIFIIKYAWGGTNLHTQWNPKGGALYDDFIKYVKVSMDYLKDKNYDANIVAMMWMQGESDANSVDSLFYENNQKNLITSIRKDLSSYIDSNMYFVDAYISQSSYWVSYKKINEAKQNICNDNDYNLCIDTIKEGLSYEKEPIDNPDLAHYDSLSEVKLGHLYIEVLFNHIS